MLTLRTLVLASLVVVCIGTSSGQAAGGEYPERPVRIVTGAPGSTMDIVSRELAPRLSERWGQPVVVDNRAGTGVSPPVVARATPDGYTLLVADSTQLAVRPHVYRSLPYDPQRDFVPISQIASTPGLLVSHPSLPASNMQEFVTYAKRQNAGIDFANAGPWTANHVAAAMLAHMTGIRIVHVNYKGGGASATAILSGEVKAGFSGPFTAGPHVQAGRLRAYAITSKRRFAGLPEIPTMAEAGVGNLVTNYWFGMLAPAGTPQTLVTSLNRQLTELLQSPRMRSLLLDRGAEPGEGTAEEFAIFIRDETNRFKQVFQAMGVSPE